MVTQQKDNPVMRLTDALESDPVPATKAYRLSDIQNPTNARYAEMNDPEAVESSKKRGLWEQTQFFLSESVAKPLVRTVKRTPAMAESLWMGGVDNLRNIAQKQLRDDGAIATFRMGDFEGPLVPGAEERTTEQQERIDRNNNLVKHFNRAEAVSLRLQKNWIEMSERGFGKRDPTVWQGTFMENPSWTRAVAISVESLPLLGFAAAVSVATKNPVAGAAVIGTIEAAQSRQEAREAGLTADQANTVFVLNAFALSALESIPMKGFLSGGGLIKRVSRGAVQEGLVEEPLQTIWQNAVAKIGYDSTRQLTEGLVESIVAGVISGGAVGGFVPGRASEIDEAIDTARKAGVDVDKMIEAILGELKDNSDSILDKFFEKMASERNARRRAGTDEEEGAGEGTDFGDIKDPTLRSAKEKLERLIQFDKSMEKAIDKGKPEEIERLTNLIAKNAFTEQEIEALGNLPPEQAASEIIPGFGETPAAEQVQIPEFKNTEEALEFGYQNKDNPQVVEALKKNREDLMRRARQLMEKPNATRQEEAEALRLSQIAQFPREALEAAEGKISQEEEARIRAKIKPPKQVKDSVAKKAEAEFVEKKLRKPPPTSKVKSAIREETGQFFKEPPTVKETRALKRSLKRQEQAARIAARAMKKETSQLIKLRRELRKPPIQSLYFEERKEINELKAQVKPRMSLEELTKIYDKVQKIKERGKKRYIAQKEISDAEFALTIKILTALHKSEGGKPPPITGATKRGLGGSPLLKAFRLARAITLRPSRWMDQLDGEQFLFNGPHHKIFYDSVNEAVQEELTMQEERKKPILDFMRQNNISVESLFDVQEVDGIKFTVSDMMGIYAAWQHPDNYLAVIYGNNIQLETIQNVVVQLERMPVYKQMADLIIKDFNKRKHFEQLNRAYIEYTDGKYELVEVDGIYIPIRRQYIVGEPTEKELARELLERKNLRRAYVGRGQTYNRQDIPPEFQTPINTDLFGLWNEHVDKTAHFITHGNLVRKMQRIVNNKQFRESIVNNKRFGQQYHEVLQRWVNRMANPNVYKSHGEASRIMTVLRGNAAIAYLSYNVVTMGKQFPSLFLALAEIDGAYLAAGIKDMTANRDETINFIHERSMQMKRRSIERELEELKLSDKAKYVRIIRKIGEFGMRGIYLIDQQVTHSIWIGAYNQFANEGQSEVEAARNADKVVLRTQPAAHSKDIADLYDINEGVNLFLQFTNQLNNIYNMVTYDIPKRARTGKKTKALVGTAGVALSALMIWMISHGRMPEDEEELAEAFSEQFVSMIPFLGPATSSYRNGFRGMSIPAFQGLYSLGEGIVDLATEPKPNAKKGRLEKAIPKFIEAGAVTLGVPYAQPRRTIAGVKDLLLGETHDLRRLIWSDFALRRKIKKGLRFRGSF